jgi:hypothetical protein
VARVLLARVLEAEQAARPDDDQVRGAEVLDDVERDRGGGEQRGEADRRRGDVDERPRRDPGHRGDARPAAVGDALRDDVEHRRPGHDEQQERGTDEQGKS